MSATAKTLGSLVLALVGLVVYMSIFVGTAVFKISAFSFAIYLGLTLTAVLMVVVVILTTLGIKDESV
ncbi:MAG TPA: hypothetical protein HPP80_02845 [Rhodospirillaceae bacterium]|nr:hypothetical protein [Rhodospirillaceae bacterium]